MMEQVKYKGAPIKKGTRYERLFKHSIEHIVEKLEKVNHSGLEKGLTLTKKHLDSNGKLDFNRQKELIPHGSINLEFNEIPDWLFGIDYTYHELDEESVNEMGYDLNDYGDYAELRIFAQHKKFINNFKYARSEFTAIVKAPVKYIIKDGERIYLDVIEGDFGSFYPNPELKYVRPFMFLWTYPDLALYKHLTGIDFNQEYITPEEAKEFNDKEIRLEEEDLNLYKRWKREIFLSVLEEINKRYGIPKRKITLRTSSNITESHYNVVIEFTPQEFVLYSGEINQLISDIDDKVTQELSSLGSWDLVRYAVSPVSSHIHSVVNGEVKHYTMNYPDLKNEDISEDTALLLIYNKERTSGYE